MNPLKAKPSNTEEPELGLIEKTAQRYAEYSLGEIERLKDPTYRLVKGYADESSKNIGYAIFILMIISPIFGGLWNLMQVEISKAVLLSMVASIITNMIGNATGAIINKKTSERAIKTICRQVYDKVNDCRQLEINQLKSELEYKERDLEQLRSKLESINTDTDELNKYKLERAVQEKIALMKEQERALKKESRKTKSANE